MLALSVPWPEPVPAPADVEFGDGAVRSAHVAVSRAARVKVSSRDRPLQVEGACHCGKRVYGARGIE